MSLPDKISFNITQYHASDIILHEIFEIYRKYIKACIFKEETRPLKFSDFDLAVVWLKQSVSREFNEYLSTFVGRHA